MAFRVLAPTLFMSASHEFLPARCSIQRQGLALCPCAVSHAPHAWPTVQCTSRSASGRAPSASGAVQPWGQLPVALVCGCAIGLGPLSSKCFSFHALAFDSPLGQPYGCDGVSAFRAAAERDASGASRWLSPPGLHCQHSSLSINLQAFRYPENVLLLPNHGRNEHASKGAPLPRPHRRLA